MTFIATSRGIATHTIGFFSSHTSADDSRWITRMSVIILLGLIVLFVLDMLFKPEKHPFKQMLIQSRLAQIDPSAIRQKLQDSINGNYFSLDLNQIEQELKQLPWVFDISVRRRWPDTLIVSVEEIQPVAHWGLDKWINIDGELVSIQPGGENLVLPKLSGHRQDSLIIWKHFRRWQGWFSTTGLKLESLKLDNRHSWLLGLSLTDLARSRFSTDQNKMAQDKMIMDIIVDGDASDAKLKRLIGVLKLQDFSNLQDIMTIDLRYPNGFAMRRKPESEINQHEEAGT